MENVTQKNHSFNGVRHETMWFPPKKYLLHFPSYHPNQHATNYFGICIINTIYDILRKIISHTNKYKKY